MTSLVENAHGEPPWEPPLGAAPGTGDLTSYVTSLFLKCLKLMCSRVSEMNWPTFDSFIC